MHVSMCESVYEYMSISGPMYVCMCIRNEMHVSMCVWVRVYVHDACVQLIFIHIHMHMGSRNKSKSHAHLHTYSHSSITRIRAETEAERKLRKYQTRPTWSRPISTHSCIPWIAVIHLKSDLEKTVAAWKETCINTRKEMYIQGDRWKNDSLSHRSL